MKWMHSFDRYVAAVFVALASVDVCAQAPTMSAADPSVDVPTVRSATAARYETLLDQEQRVSTSPAATADDFRTVINRYWAFVRRYPTNGYADNALWQAANLSAAAFQRFSQDRDKYRAVQLFQWLRDQYPHSPLQARASTNVEQLETAAAAAIPAPGSTPAPANVLPATAAAAAAADTTTVRAVHREVLADIVRVTVELDREVAFYQERLDGPARVFFDLKGTKTVPSLVDATFRYDSDVVRHIRLGRHPNSTTRVVLDLENVSRYSVFTLYNPYRIVIDAERAGRATVATKDGETVGTVSAAAVDKVVGRRIALSAARAPIAPITSTVAPASAPRTPIVRQVPVPVASTSAPTSQTASTSAPPSHIATVDKMVDRPSAPNAPSAPGSVITGKPISPSANSSGKFSVARQLGLGVSRIVIDAGHGGHDPGASAFGISEADLVLDVTLRLEKLLLEQPGIEVVLTRRTNDYVSLDERTEIANRESADLFLSVHANASANATARGVETYFLNFALNPQAEAVAARENAASGKTMSSLPSIIKAITLNSKLNESRDFAASIQRSLVRGMRGGNKTLKDLGVKQAPFMVLIGASMPSVLAEISFVTNQQEARLLKLPGYRQRIAESLLAGILRYQQSLKKVQSAAALQ
jgi:N-acetylmuramoyl-L-alanine amidase